MFFNCIFCIRMPFQITVCFNAMITICDNDIPSVCIKKRMWTISLITANEVFIPCEFIIEAKHKKNKQT